MADFDSRLDDLEMLIDRWRTDGATDDDVVEVLELVLSTVRESQGTKADDDNGEDA